MIARRTKNPKIAPRTMPTVAEGVPAELPRGNRMDRCRGDFSDVDVVSENVVSIDGVTVA